MALECVCFPVTKPKVIRVGTMPMPSATRMKSSQPKYCKDSRKPKAEIDICKILERSQDERNRHNNYECHLKGERRQNLINKMKMFLDDYDDRPVMKRRSKEGDGKALGQTGFGPLIKYPGYVDYDHPYFSDPYNKMPTLATTMGRRGDNPCPPISVRNWDATKSQAGLRVDAQEYEARRGVGERSQEGCHCARRRGQVAKCPAASAQHQGGGGPGWTSELGYQSSSPGLICDCMQVPMSSGTATGGLKYFCYPFPED